MVIGIIEDHGTVETATLTTVLIEEITPLIFKGLLIIIRTQTNVVETYLL